jgi:YD repeat-containing protein
MASFTVVILLVAVFAGATHAVTYAYDPLGRLVSVVYDDNTRATFNYDAAGNLLSVTNAAADTKATAFSFAARFGVGLSTRIESNAIAITGIDSASAVSVTTGEYCVSSAAACSCDVTAYTSAAGSIFPGQSVCVRHTSSPNGGTATTTSLRIGIGANQVTGSFQSTTLVTAPNAPTNVNATNNSGLVTVTFSAPNAGGSAITGYTVYSVPAGGVDAQAGTTATSHSISGLTLGSPYRFYVKATNAQGTGPDSPLSQTVIPATLPSPPLNVVASAGNGQASVSFSPPTDTGGRELTGYTVTSIPSGGVDSNAGSLGSPHTITGLTNGTAYTFTVKATNAVGASVASAASNSVTPSASATVSISTAALPAGTVGVPYSQTINATGGTPPYTFLATNLPQGVSLSSAGALSGTPLNAGTSAIIVSAMDNTPASSGGPHFGSKSLSLTRSLGVPILTLTSNANPVPQGQSVQFTVTLSGSGEAPTGIAHFLKGATSFLCAASEVVAGQAICTATGLASGSNSITATYPGDANYQGAVSLPLTQIVAGSVSISVTKNGSGSGTVTSDPTGISCGSTCSMTVTTATPVTFTATPDAGFVFTGWLGACTGRSTCLVNAIDATTVSATFAPDTLLPLRIDVDGNGQYSAATDGLLIARYLMGVTGNPLTAGSLGASASRTDSATLLVHLNDVRPLLDIDGDGIVDAQTDGLLILRYLAGFRGDTLVAGAVAQGAGRFSATDLEAYLASIFH